jgi:hypothetical protein
VTVTFNQAAAFPDVRILEYRGVTTLDLKAGLGELGRMQWTARSEKDKATDTLEKRLWAAADQLRANSGLTCLFSVNSVQAQSASFSDIVGQHVIYVEGTTGDINQTFWNNTTGGPWVVQDLSGGTGAPPAGRDRKRWH